MSTELMQPSTARETDTSALNLPPVPKLAKTKSPSLHTWLDMPELAEAMSYMRARSNEPATPSEKLIAAQLKNVQKHEIGFVSNDKFGDRNAPVRVFSAELSLSKPKPRNDSTEGPRTIKSPPDHLGRLCEATLLTQKQEAMLFERMNFLRFQAAKQRALLTDDLPLGPQLQLIDQLLALADWHRDRIVEANTRLVFSIVKKFVNENNRFDELLSDGVVALMHAVDKFDFGRGFRFSTYATTVLRRYAYREVLENQERRSKTVTGLHDMNLDVVDDRDDHGISEKRWLKLRNRLGGMLTELNRREKFIIRARFSLGSHRKTSTLQALATRLGISKERVRQLEHRGLEKLRLIAGKLDV